MGLRHRIAIPVENAIKADEVIVAYKKKSRGEIMAIYNSINEIVKKEMQYNERFCHRCVADILIGKTKYSKILHLQAAVTFRIKKLSEVKDALK